MSERVIKVFYNGECLPFKDKERVVHYPVTQGHIFMGASNTTEIRFYCDQIGGGSNQWIVIGKLPNGKRGFHILGNYLEDEDGGYYSFHLSQFFTQYKGDLYLSLGGYNGNIVELNQEEEYELTGNTLIETTGSIRLTIEYSTPINGSDDEIDTWQEFLGALGEKADKGDVILPYISYAILESDYDNYDNGQFYFCEETRTIYRKVSGALTPVLVVYNKQQIDNLLNDKVDKLTTSGVYAYIHNGSVQGELAVSTPATGDTIAKRESDGRLKVGTPISSGDATTKGYVDNLIDTIKSGELEIVNTTTYPTLNDFLATTGEEGHIYLYPIDINDLTKGYYRYAWEEISGTEQWVSLGTTEIDLSDYYTKTQADNKFVEQVSGKGLSSNDFTDNDKDKLDGIESGAEVNVINEITVDNVALTPTDKSVNIDLSGKQDLLISGTNIKSINNTSLLGSGNIDYDNALSDSSTNAVQNKVLKGYLDDIGNRLAVLEESIISDDNLNYTYLSDSAIPASVNTYPIIESAGIDNTNIKGNSFVYNQLLTKNTTSSQTFSGVTITNNGDGSFTFNGTLNTSYNQRVLLKQVELKANHKYFAPKGDKGVLYLQTEGDVFLSFADLRVIETSGTYNIGVRLGANTTYTNETIAPQVFDLTQMGLNSVSTVDEAIAELLKRGINVYEYSPSSSGKINDSKPTALISKSFNVWDEQWELGAYSGTTGEKVSANTQIRSKNYIPVIPNTNYYIKSPNAMRVSFYDKNYSFIEQSDTTLQNTTFLTQPNCAFITFHLVSTYGTTYNRDICINISNASLNGTYRPYKAPINYPLNLPVLRSAGSVQDDTKKVNVVRYTFTGNENWGKLTSSGKDYYRFYLSVHPTTNDSNFVKYNNLISDINGSNVIRASLWETQSDTFIGYNISYGSFHISNYLYQNRATLLVGKTIIYERATPTDQPAITLPENIEFEKGGSLEVVYDETAPTPADFDFEVAVYKPIE